MSSSKNYDKKIHKDSELGKLEARIKRFYNIKQLAEAFDKSEDGNKVRDLRDKAVEEIQKMANEFEEIQKAYMAKEKEFDEKLKESAIERMRSEVEILNNFEKTFNN